MFVLLRMPDVLLILDSALKASGLPLLFLTGYVWLNYAEQNIE